MENPTEFVSRKQKRKNAKAVKKLQKFAFSKKQKVESVIREKFKETKKEKEKKKRRKRKLLESEETNREEESDFEANLTYEKYLQEVSDIEKSRRIGSEASKEDDMSIHKYARLLGLNKKSKTKTPKSFCDDGLDAILEFCDAEDRDTLLANEKNFHLKGSDLDDKQESGEEEEDEEPNGDIDISEGSEVSDEDDELDDGSDYSGSGNEEAGSFFEEKEDITEDIYGRTVKRTTGELIHFDSRAAQKKLAELDNTTGDNESRLKVTKTITGILNRLSDGTLIKSKNNFVELWNSSSKNDTKTCLANVVIKMMTAPYRLPDSMMCTYAVFLSLIHATVSSEISAHLLEVFMKDYLEGIRNGSNQDDKAMENKSILIAHFLNFKIVRSNFILDVIREMRKHFTEENLSLIIILCTYAHKSMKKMSAVQFSEEIADIDTQLQSSSILNGSRGKFLHDVLIGLKKNMPDSFDYSVIEKQLKVFHGILKQEKGNVEKELGMDLQDLMEAEERGRWWIVGSAFRQKTDVQSSTGAETSSGSSFPEELVALANKAKMNSSVRQNVFCTVVSADSEDSAFEKLLKLSLKGQQEREIIYVILQMSLIEKVYNMYYTQLIKRFCEFDRRFGLTTQYAIWDRIKDSQSLKKRQQKHLATFIHQIIRSEVLPITILKVVEWGTLNSSTSSIIRHILTLLKDCPTEKLKRIFLPLTIDKNYVLAEGLRLFLQINFSGTDLLRNIESILGRE